MVGARMVPFFRTHDRAWRSIDDERLGEGDEL